MHGQSMIVVVGFMASAIGSWGCAAETPAPVGRHALPLVCEGLVTRWNSNEDAEIKAEVDAVADECESTPVGRSDFGRSARFVDGSPIASRTDKIQTDGRRLEGSANIDTGWRFCNCAFANVDAVFERLACANDINYGCLIADLEEFENEEPLYWKRMRLTKVGGGDASSTISVAYDGPNERDGGDDGFNFFYPHFDPSITLDWDVVSDAQDWGVQEAGGWNNFVLPGVLWTHARGTTDGAVFSDELRELTNNYISGIVGIADNNTPDTDTNLPIGPAPMPYQDKCPHCPWSFPAGFLLIPSCFGNTGCTDPAEARFEWMVQNAGSFFAGGAPSGLGGTVGSWVAVSEPDMAQGTTGLRYAAVATNGTTVSSMLTLSSSGLSRTVPANYGTKPSSRSLFGVAASVIKNRIWVVGGINGSGSLLQDLYQYNVATQTWSQVTIPGSYKPSRVLAVAYAPNEDRLLVLDQVTSGGSVRLLRIDPNGSASAQLVASWSRTASTTTFGITAEVGNRGYLVACGGSTSHGVLRFKKNATGGVSIWSNATGSGAMASRGVLAGMRGISLLVNVNGLPRARGYETRNMTSGGSSSLCF